MHTHMNARMHTYSKYLYLQEQPGGRRREGQEQKQVTCRTDHLSSNNTRGFRPWKKWLTPLGPCGGQESHQVRVKP